MKTRYGKDDVSVYRTDGVRTLRGAAVRIDVFGDTFEASYTEGDNSMVVTIPRPLSIEVMVLGRGTQPMSRPISIVCMRGVAVLSA